MIQTKSIEELINEYYEVAKEYFKLNNIKLSKTGVIGFLLYVLGHIKKDSEYYYNYLAKELFPATATEYTSLLLHASLFGYQPSFANPATYKGNITIYLPSDNISKLKSRTIKIPKYTQFIINNTIWTLDADATIIEDFVNGTFYANFISANRIEKVPIIRQTNPQDPNTEIVTLDLLYLRQYEYEEITFTVPFYDYGTYYRYELTIPDDKYLCDLEVLVKMPGETQYTQYEISFAKFGFSSTDRVVFVSQTDVNKYVIEFGNGVNGIHLPMNTEVLIKYKYTLGSKANFYNGVLQLKDVITVIEKYVDETEKTYTLDKSVVAGGITQPITDGKDVETAEEIRSNIIKYIRTRNLLVKYSDYQDLLGDMNKFAFLFKKVDFVDNDVYIYAALYNDLFQPYKTASVTLAESDFNPNNDKYIYLHEYTYVKQKLVTYPTDVTVTSDVSDSSTIPVSDASVFSTGERITFNNNLDTIYTIQSVDTTNNQITIDQNVTVSANSTIQKVDNEKVNMLSPFMYKYNSLLDSYEGYLIDDSEIYLNVLHITPNTKVPNIFMTFSTDNNFSSVTFKVNSFDNSPLDDYKFYLTIPELNINNILLDSTNDYSYTLTFSDETTQDNAFDSLTRGANLTLKITDLLGNNIATLYKESYAPINDITDLLILKKYYTTDTTYVTQIPYISEDEYNLEKQKIITKLKTLLINTNITNNRLISVQHSFRFFNTLELLDASNYLNDETTSSLTYIDLPLKLNLYIIFDKNKIIQDGVSVSDLIDQLKLDIAKLLDESYTGAAIQFYTSKLEDYIHNNKYVKYVKVVTPNYNIVTKSFTDYLKTISDDKYKVVSFNPSYFYWNLDDIGVDYEIE